MQGEKRDVSHKVETYANKERWWHESIGVCFWEPAKKQYKMLVEERFGFRRNWRVKLRSSLHSKWWWTLSSLASCLNKDWPAWHNHDWFSTLLRPPCSIILPSSDYIRACLSLCWHANEMINWCQVFWRALRDVLWHLLIDDVALEPHQLFKKHLVRYCPICKMEHTTHLEAGKAIRCRFLEFWRHYLYVLGFSPLCHCSVVLLLSY